MMSLMSKKKENKTEGDPYGVTFRALPIDDVREVNKEGDRPEYAKGFVFVDFTKEGN